MEGSVGAVVLCPVGGGPAVVVEIADAGVVGCDPVGAWKADVEDFVHVAVDGKVCVEEDGDGKVGEGEGAKLGPCVLEAGSYGSGGGFP